jgi:hypothetical protein
LLSELKGFKVKKLFSKASFFSLLVLVALLMTAFLLPCAPTQAAESDPQCWAVIVGVADYESIDDLPYPAQDVTSLYQELSPVWGENHMQLLTNSQATKMAILSAIDWLVDNADVDDTVLFCFAGHGASGGYLCPYDTTDLISTLISSTELANALLPVKAQKITVILSCCHAGAFKSALAKDGRVILMACKSYEVGWESYDLGHVVFLYFVLEAFNNFDEADINHDYELSAEEIFAYAGYRTSEYEEDNDFPSIQHPNLGDYYYSELALIAKFVFALNTSLPYGTQILTLDGISYTSVPSYLLWIPGSTHTISVPEAVYLSEGTRYAFTSWNDGDTLTARTISRGFYSPGYNLEQLLDIISAFGDPVGANWYVDGTTASFSVTPYIELPDTRHIFIGWSGDFTGPASQGLILMDAPKSLIADWRTEYLLTLNSEYGRPVGAGWYDELNSVNISIEPVQGFIIRQMFDGWTGDLASVQSSVTVTMDSPKVITATWHTDYVQLYIFIVVILVVAGIGTTVIIIIVRRKRAALPVPPPDTPPPPPSSYKN